jgi:carbonic anhydrase
MRAFLCVSSLLAGASAALLVFAPTEAAARTDGAELDARARLAAGNERFASGEPERLRQSFERRTEVARGQAPFAVIVGCADSRVPPELVFDQGLGDLFVVRCAGNVLGEAAVGSIEYAVEHLGCELVVVLGHERCGAVDAVLKGGALPGHLAAFTPTIGRIVPEARLAGGDALDRAVRLNAARIAADLRACDPILAERVHAGELEVLAARYDLDTGAVEWLESRAGPPH